MTATPFTVHFVNADDDKDIITFDVAYRADPFEIKIFWEFIVTIACSMAEEANTDLDDYDLFMISHPVGGDFRITA